jgi:diguanylate cyclase (GGDEF)-like protein
MLWLTCTVYADFTRCATVPRLDNQKSLQKQLAVAAAMCVLPAAITACILRTDPHALQFTLLVSLFSTIACFVSMQRRIAPLHALQEDHDAAQTKLAQRTQTVDRLLDFSQTIQGAGKSEQIFETLSFYLRTELSLAGIVMLAQEPDTVPATTIKASWPEKLLRVDSHASELETALCPCLRQNLPRHFKPDGSPVRCAIDNILSLPASHPAYCIPFNLGRGTQVLVHMLLPVDETWTEARRQLAHTYVNTAHSALMSLHMLSEAEKQSMTDALTGLYNRRSMEQLMQREVALSERHGHPLSLVMIDMDKFKEINDAHGHAAGDYMLKAFADCVRITLRKTDLAFRYGGDEFVIALPQTHVAQAQQVVQKLRQAYASVDFADAIANLEHQPTLSIGLAERSKTTNLLTLSAVLGAADQALYDAKANNRNCVKVYQAAPPQQAAAA